MPKIIENLREKLLLEARKQIEETGYSAMTIRSVATACGVGIGTVYNYFSSKEELIAGFMLDDWKECIRSIGGCSAEASCGIQVAHCIYDQLNFFLEKHKILFQDPAAGASFSSSGSKYHGLLRSQLAKPMEPYCSTAFEAEFLAEALLTWTVAGKDWAALEQVMRKIMEA